MKAHFLNIMLACIGVCFTAQLTSCSATRAASQASHQAAAIADAGGSAGGSLAAAAAPHSTVKEVVHGQAVLFSVLGVALILGGMALCYFQFYIPAVKLFLAGVILPVVGIIWSEHYAIILTLGLVGLAVWYMLTHQAAVSAIVKEIGPGSDQMLAEIKSLATIGTAAKSPAVNTVAAGQPAGAQTNIVKPV